MRAMVLEAPGRPLRLAELPEPPPADGQLPLVLGHQVVATDVATGERMGVPWLGWTDGTCAYCRSGRENICVAARFTGKDIDGGYAERLVADARFCFPLPAG